MSELTSGARRLLRELVTEIEDHGRPLCDDELTDLLVIEQTAGYLRQAELDAQREAKAKEAA